MLWIYKEITDLKAECYHSEEKKKAKKWGFAISKMLFYGNIGGLCLL